MYQTHLHTHFSHLGHAFERLKHLFWFGLSKVQAINSAGYVFHDKLIIMPSSHLRALPGEIKWKVAKLSLLTINYKILCLSCGKKMSLLHFSTCKSAPFPPWTGLSAGSVYGWFGFLIEGNKLSYYYFNALQDYKQITTVYI